MARKSDNYYYDMFVKLIDYSCAAAAFLDETLHSFQTIQMVEKLEQMHIIEHTADLEKHSMMKRLVKEFITPIEREDIISLVQGIDDITDSVEDVLRNLCMFNVKSLRPEVFQFSEIIVKSCEKMKMVMTEFSNFKKSSTIYQDMVEVNELEEDGDDLHFAAMRDLYAGCSDAVEIMIWTNLFERLEECCDACEDVSEKVESVMMKNS